MEHLLYSTGERPRPFFRGVLHTIVFMSGPLYAIPIINICNDWRLAIVTAAYIYILIISHGVSAIYHRWQLTPRQEKLFSKLDQIALLLSTNAGNMVIFYLVIPEYIYLFYLNFIFTAGFSIIVALMPYNAFNRYVFGITATATILAYYIACGVVLYSKLDRFEFNLYVASCVIFTLGTFMYIWACPDIEPAYCGFHEVFHFVEVFSLIIVYILNYRIIKNYQ